MTIQNEALQAQGQYSQNQGRQAPSFITEQGYGTQPIQGYGQSIPQTSTNLEEELAMIRGLKAGSSSGSGGLGSTIGAGVGTAGGAAIGGSMGGPVGAGIGAAAGGALGGSIGSVVDYMIDSDAREKAERKQIEARRRLLKKKKRLANKKAVDEAKARYRGIATSREESARQANQAKIAQRENYMFEIMQDLQKQGQVDGFIKNKLINSRSI